MKPLDPQSRRLIDEASSGDMPTAELQEQLWQRLAPRMSEALPPTAAAASQALTAKSSLLIGAGTWLKLAVTALFAGVAVTGAVHSRNQLTEPAAAPSPPTAEHAAPHEAKDTAKRGLDNQEHLHLPFAAQPNRAGGNEHQSSAAQANRASKSEQRALAAQPDRAGGNEHQSSAAQASSASEREQRALAAQPNRAGGNEHQSSAAQANRASKSEQRALAAQPDRAGGNEHQSSAAQASSASKSEQRALAAQRSGASQREQQHSAAQSDARGSHAPQVLAAQPSILSGSELQPTAAARNRAAAHDLERERVPSGQGSTLMAETQLLARAQQALRAGKTTAALRLIDEHVRTFPRGELAQERDAAEVVALCALHRWPEARRSQQQFQRAWPGSPMTERVQHACAALNDSGTSPETRSKP